MFLPSDNQAFNENLTQANKSLNDILLNKIRNSE
jgi:hypothetical protein